MYLYNKEQERVKFNITPENRIGNGMYGSVFKLSEDICLKVYKNSNMIEGNILDVIRKLNLPNFYKIYDFYYQKNQKLKAHTMEYYEPKDIDILTAPTEYTLDNLFNLYKAIQILIKNNILMSDTHTENIILGDKTITVIDTDLYTSNRFHKGLELELKNKIQLKGLFSELYKESIVENHPELETYFIIETIKNMFMLYNDQSYSRLVDTLSKYQYPIDYFRDLGKQSSTRYFTKKKLKTM